MDSCAANNHVYLWRKSVYDIVVTTENIDSSAGGDHVMLLSAKLSIFGI